MKSVGTAPVMAATPAATATRCAKPLPNTASAVGVTLAAKVKTSWLVLAARLKATILLPAMA